MTAGFALRLAWRESRSTWRRIGLYAASIALGVGALVAINSFRSNVVASIQREARTLLGADARIGSRTDFPPAVRSVLDSLDAAGRKVAYETTVLSMVLAPRSGHTRLLQVRAVEGGYPFYGALRTQPAGVWRSGRAGGVVVDPAVLVQLGARVGDTLAIGDARFPIVATVEDAPADVGFQAAVGPRVFLNSRGLEATGLVQTGSLVRHQAYLRIPEREALAEFEERYEPFFREQLVDFDTATEQAQNLAGALETLTRFLGLVGLMALLLGGLGVGSAIHVFVKEKLTSVAVLRCLGATQRTVFLAYLLQAAALGLAGAAVGALLGVAVQGLVPQLTGGLLPVDLGVRVDLWAVAAGIAMGIWVASAFALLPLLEIRDVAPLQALRRGFEPLRPRRDPLRLLTGATLFASIAALSVWQAPSTRIGFAFAVGLACVFGILWLLGRALAGAARQVLPARASYVLRQGIGNLFRPRNQTSAVILSLGFGVFLLATLALVQRGILDRLSLDDAQDRPNLLLFDVQAEQRAELGRLLGARGLGLLQPSPIVPARMRAINGIEPAELLARPAAERPEAWALRREYRHTYRDTLVRSERLVAGEWWEAAPPLGAAAGGGRAAPPAGRSAGEPARISLEADLARSLGVGLGDRVTWDVQGVPVETRVASLRTVDWARFEPNFFVVFEPGVLEEAPQSWIGLVRVPGATERADLQREIVERLPNVSALDLARVQETLDAIAEKVALAVRALAAFGLAAGLLVLFSAAATSRFQRVREGALLRTLGATRSQIVGILLTEYVALGSFAGLAGVVLALGAGWLITTRVLELPLVVSPWLLVTLGGAAAGAAALVGLMASREVVGGTPLEVLRQAGE